jgi:hypothetical protein
MYHARAVRMSRRFAFAILSVGFFAVPGARAGAILNTSLSLTQRQIANDGTPSFCSLALTDPASPVGTLGNFGNQVLSYLQN